MFPLKHYNTYNLNSFARYVYFPRSINEIIDVYKMHENKVIILGNGSNIIFRKFYYGSTAFIIVKDNLSKIFFLDKEEGEIYAQAGCLLKTLSIFAYQHNMSGIETFYDIPASVGGAIVMNTGAYGDEIYDCILCVDVFDIKNFTRKRIFKSDISYGYRYSMFQSNKYFIFGAIFKLNTKTQLKIKEKMYYVLEKRKAKLPFEPSAGSVFKRPNKHTHYDCKTVGQMVEKLGLKGFQVGGAKISEKHGGIIVNTGAACGTDILQLIKYIKEKVHSHYNIKLELEQIVI